jgi:hypothetical protein
MISIYSLEQGVVYIVSKPFDDYYGNHFSAGDKLTYVGRNFSPYQGGHTITFKEAGIYLHEGMNQDIIDSFDEYLALYDASGRVPPAAQPSAPQASKKEGGLRERILRLLSYLAFLALGLWIVLFDRPAEIFIRLGGYICVVFSSLSAIATVKEMLKKRG